MFSAINLIGRCTTVKNLNTQTWILRGATFITSPQSTVMPFRQYSQQQSQKTSSASTNALAEAKSQGGSEVSTATAFETVKETTKTAGNLGVILLGVGIAGSILWTIFNELLSSNSPNNIYSSAFDKCVSDTRVKDHLGEPIKAYGEENRRGRRRHTSHSVYEVKGKKHMVQKFYLQGSRKKGTAYVELVEDDKGNFQRTLLVLELDDLLRTTVVVEDNRTDNIIQNDTLPTLY